MDHLLQRYHRLGYTQDEMRVSLAVKHSIVVSVRQLKRHLSRLRLFRRKHHTDIAEVTVFIMNELRTCAQQLGYRMMHLRCLNAGLVVSRDTVRHLLGLLDPRGVELRRKGRIVRRRYLSKGANFVWHLDSYDKLKPYGICINGCIDGFSRNVIWLEAYHTSSDAKLIAGYFMQSVKRLGGCPMRIRGDMGTENSNVALLQQFMRRDGLDRWAGESSFLYGKSTANQRIESFWSILRKQHCQFWISRFKVLKEEGDFTGTYLDKALIRFCFLQLIQVVKYKPVSIILYLSIPKALFTARVFQKRSRPHEFTLCRRLHTEALQATASEGPTWRLERDSNPRPSV